MIIDKLKNAELYYRLDEKIEKALKFLVNNDLSKFENCKHQIEGDDIFVVVQDYETKPENDHRWEAHRVYTDIQVVIKGKEKMGWANISKMKPITDYDIEKDVTFLEGEGDFVSTEEGYFVLFTPEDAHKPAVMIGNPAYVKKAIVKIKCRD